MVGLLQLLAAWALLTPALVLLFLRLGGPYHPVMAPALSMAASFPLLAFMTAAGFAMMFLSVRRLARVEDRNPPPH